MSERINNGRRVQVAHSIYSGQAGLVERTPGRAQIALPIAKPVNVRMEGEIAIDGEAWVIEAVTPSRTEPKKMLVVQVRKAAVSESQTEA